MRAVAPFLVALSLVLVVATVRVVLEGRSELTQAREAEASGDLEEAVTRYQYAMRWYAPLTSAPVAGADALTRLADDAAARGDRTAELSALRRLRGGILSTRSFFTPFGDRLDAVNSRLAMRSAEEQLAQGLGRGGDLTTLTTEHARLLALDPTPATGWALAATLGFLGWTGGALGFILRGLDAGLRLVQPAAQRFAALFLTSFGMWVLGLWLA